MREVSTAWTALWVMHSPRTAIIAKKRKNGWVINGDSASLGLSLESHVEREARIVLKRRIFARDIGHVYLE